MKLRSALFAVAVGVVAVHPDSACRGVATIDLSPFFDSDETSSSARLAAARALDAAMRTLGMACVLGHGVTREAALELEAHAGAFFEQPLEAKRRGDWATYGPEGYTALGVEAVARSVASSTDAAPDVVESFAFRSRPPASCADEPRDALSTLPDAFCAAARRYWDVCEATLRALHAAKASALGVDAEVFDSKFSPGKAGNALRLAHYPAASLAGLEASGALPYGAHTDYQTLTLLFATASGLQVQSRAGEWLDVEPPATASAASNSVALVVNAGDLSELWSGGRWRSAPHRVLPRPEPTARADGVFYSKRRASIAFFTGPDDDALIEPLLDPLAPARHSTLAPVTSGEHLRAKLAATSVRVQAEPHSHAEDEL